MEHLSNDHEDHQENSHNLYDEKSEAKSIRTETTTWSEFPNEEKPSHCRTNTRVRRNKTNTMTDGLIGRTSAILYEIASKTVHKEEGDR